MRNFSNLKAMRSIAGNLNRTRNAKVPLVIIALVAVIGFSFALTFTSCDNGTTRGGPSLNSTWSAGGGALVVNINGSNGTITQIGSLTGYLQDAVRKGYISVGSQYYRNLRQTGDLSWSGQVLGVRYNTSAPSVALGVAWVDTTITMNANGQSFYCSAFGNTFTRR